MVGVKLFLHMTVTVTILITYVHCIVLILMKLQQPCLEFRLDGVVTISRMMRVVACLLTSFALYVNSVQLRLSGHANACLLGIISLPFSANMVSRLFISHDLLACLPDVSAGLQLQPYGAIT